MAIRDEFMITRQGKQYVLFAGLLDEFHSDLDEYNDATASIETELLQIPSEDNGNIAIVHACVGYKGVDGEWVHGPFHGIGDASPDNVGRNIITHKIRMAETRAKARALRDAVNVGATSLEELSDDGDAPASTPVNQARREKATPPAASAGVQKGGATNANRLKMKKRIKDLSDQVYGSVDAMKAAHLKEGQNVDDLTDEQIQDLGMTLAQEKIDADEGLDEGLAEGPEEDLG